ncbi:MAG: glycosyltransferase family 1 protein [Candidatus Promineifilaceae bacterium]|nr:glycosyltransferase family 1 protein [Candidatus Promineifilaceae bacterium]
MIYVDVSAAVHGRAGLGRYSQRLAAALADELPSELALFYNRGRDGRLPQSLARLPRRSVSLGYKPWRSAILLAQLARISFARLVPDVRLYHSTEHLLFPLPDRPTVLTVHDLIFKLFPAYHKRLNYWYLNLAMPLFCRRATAIIAVSEASKRDIITHYGIEASKIHVIYEAAGPAFQPPDPNDIARVRAKYRLPDSYLVHLGTLEPRKNLVRLLETLQALRRQRPALHLVLVGSRGWLYEDFFARLAADGLEEAVVTLGWVSDEDLPAVLAAAELAVQPSLYEGFGLPLLEQMAVGQVVAASDRASLPEVGGEAAAYFDPVNTEDMIAVVDRLLGDADEKEHRRRLGLERAAQFSWRRAARETKALYEQLLH